jgi:hypothetical protein
MRRNVVSIAAAISLTAGIAACQRHVSVGSAPMETVGPNMLTAQEQKAGWRLLFDGTSLKNFRDYKADTLSSAWQVVDGVITKTRGGVEDIVTREKFADFDLMFDWRLSPGGNSGAFFRATEEYDKIYWSAPEFQLLDDSLAPDGKNILTSAGAAYGLYPTIKGITHPGGGEWNTARIVARGSHVEHWMNGKKLLEYEAWSPDWQARVAKSKFHAYPDFGLAKTGMIGFQGDHPGKLELRNIKIRVLQ